MKKTRQTVEVPLKRYTGQFWKRGRAAKHGPYVFYNPATGDRFHDVKLGLKSAVKRAGLSGITWHTFRHTFTSRLTRNGAGPHERKGTAGTFDGDGEHAVRAFERRSEAPGVGQTAYQ